MTQEPDIYGGLDPLISARDALHNFCDAYSDMPGAPFKLQLIVLGEPQEGENRRPPVNIDHGADATPQIHAYIAAFAPGGLPLYEPRKITLYRGPKNSVCLDLQYHDDGAATGKPGDKVATFFVREPVLKPSAIAKAAPNDVMAQKFLGLADIRGMGMLSPIKWLSGRLERGKPGYPEYAVTANTDIGRVPFPAALCPTTAPFS